MDTSTEENEPNSSAAVSNSDGEKKHSMMNGLTNGYDKEKKEKSSSSHKEKHDDKDREREKHRDKDDKHRSKDGDKHRDKHREHKDKERDKEKDKHRDKDKEKERDKSKHSSSSSSKDKHSSSSSSKDKDRDKERKDKDKDKERSKHHDDKDRKDKEHKSSSSLEHKSSSSSSKDKSSSSNKHSSSSSKPSSSSSSKDKEHRDKERDKDKHRDRDKEKDKERSKDKDKEKDKHSSSSSKDKERHGSDKDKHRSDKDKHRSSSSSKDKDRHSTSSSKDKDKHRDKERTKDKQKELETEVKQEIKEELPEIKQERYEDTSFNNTSIKDESMDDDDDYNKLTIKEEATDDDESKMDFTASSIDMSGVKKEQDEDDDDIPMAARMEKMNSRFLESDDEDDMPLIARKKPKKESSAKKRKKADSDYEDDEEDFKPAKKKKIKKEVETKKKKSTGSVKEEIASPKKKKKVEEEQEVWKWWEEEKKPDGVKWNFLEHKGPVFAAPYEPLPDKVKFYYDDQEFKLSEPAEEVATFYARMLDHDYTTKKAFNTNFMTDWRSLMTEKERKVITELKKCNFKHMHAYFLKKSEERKAMSKEEKKAIKEENEKIAKEYGFCMIDGHKEKIGNFKIEPPGLFRGRGEHPKMGKLKRRVVAEDIIINCSKKSNIPQPPPGHRWKEVRHDNAVTWLASWTENVQGQVKYIMLNPSSKLKGEKDWQKYEMARKLAKSIDKIREDYTADWKSKEMRVRQRAVAMYFIDKLALRAGNEKDEDQADTVGCCSLRVEHISLHEEKDGKENVVVFDFLGKDSIRYYNEVPVEKRVFKNLVLFMENKKGEDDLFDRLNTGVLNKHLSDLMDGLTAKVFRTYNASWTLQAQLKELTDPDSTVAEKMLSYNRANRAVAILCNHQRAVPKTHDKSMANLREKLQAKRDAVSEAEKSYKHAKRDAKNGGSVKERTNAEKAKKTLERLKEQLQKLELQETDKEENKTIALGTSKLNYLDPRISVAWCKKYDVPIEKIYNKTQRDKFRWAIDMATADYVF